MKEGLVDGDELDCRNGHHVTGYNSTIGMTEPPNVPPRTAVLKMETPSLAPCEDGITPSYARYEHSREGPEFVRCP